MLHPKKKIPRHVAIIMDGNRRWAKERKLPAYAGHRAGYEAFRRVSLWCLDQGVKVLTIFAFSTENWSRPKPEVGYLLKLLKFALRREVDFFDKRNVRLNVLGRISDFPKEMQRLINDALEKTKGNTKAVLNVALNYGGRAEIVDAAKKMIARHIPASRITERLFGKFLYSPQLPDPDLIIRTSGELRLSGFLLWESAYAELFFSKKYWPDFTPADLEKAIGEYQGRQRRFGG